MIWGPSRPAELARDIIGWLVNTKGALTKSIPSEFSNLEGYNERRSLFQRQDAPRYAFALVYYART